MPKNTQPDAAYIGLMSGTSLDGVDCVIAQFHQENVRLTGTVFKPYPTALREEIRLLCLPGDNEIQRMGYLDNRLGEFYADTVAELLQKTDLKPENIRAIGCHGQTVRHQPPEGKSKPGFTLQIGNPNIMASKTGITTVSDFRRMDMAYGGEGAPLVPAFHQAMFHHEKTNRVILNIGGISNITTLPAEGQPGGFDTGPGNTLLDAWIRQQLDKNYDLDGEWAASGTADEVLVDQLLKDPYFSRLPPKSTGPEYFNLQWLNNFLKNFKGINPENVQATLLKLTSRSIADALTNLVPFAVEELYVCGGGAHNTQLMASLKEDIPALKKLEITTALGLEPDWVEAAAFAWLAKRRVENLPGNLTTVTGANSAAILGGVYTP